MGLAIQTEPIIEWRRPKEIAECHLLQRGFTINLPFFGCRTVVQFYKGKPDFPPTPKTPEQWRVGFVQNAIRQSMDITWQDSSGEVTKSWSTKTSMLDASAGTQLPFYSRPTVFFPGDKVKQESFIHYSDIAYGGAIGARLWAGNSQIDVDDPWTGLPYQSYDLDLIDTPMNFIWAFHNDNQAEPLLEFKRSLTLQFWVVAVSFASVSDKSKYFILGQSNQFTVSCVFRRRSNHGTTCEMDAFDVVQDTDVSPNIQFNNVVGPKQATAPRPVISGDLSNKPAKEFLWSLGFAPQPKP